MKLSDGAARIRPSGGNCSCELGASQITRIRVPRGRHRGQCSVCRHWITARRNVWASTPSKRPPGSRRSNRFVRAFTNTSTASRAGSADGLKLRHDNGSVHMSDDFQSEIQYLDIEPSPLSSVSSKERLTLHSAPPANRGGHSPRTAVVFRV